MDKYRISTLVCTCIIVMSLFMGSALPVCAASTEEKTGNAATSESAVENNTSDGVRQEKVQKAKDVYSSFVKGEGSAVFHTAAMDICYFISLDRFNDGGEYTLKDVINIFKTAADDVNKEHPQSSAETPAARLTGVEYAVLEEGSFPILALHISGEGFVSTEKSELVCVMHYDQESDQLNVVYCADAWSRRHIAVNKAGVIKNYGSGSASEYSYTYLTVGEKGNLLHLYSFSASNSLVAGNEDLEDWQKRTCLFSYYLDLDPFNQEEMYQREADIFTLHQADNTDNTFCMETEGKYDTDDAVYKLYTEDGTQLVSNQAAARAILKHASEMAVSAEAFFADPADWVTIE